MDFIRDFNVLNGELVVRLMGEINSNTAPEVEKEILDTIKDKEFTLLSLDLEEVTYVSSAGLRVILKLKQTYKDVRVINTSLSVYDVLQMTGFTNIMEVSKALNKVSVDGCEVIGDGFTATVFRLDKDTIVKKFKTDVEIKEVERELSLAKQAFILGIPTAISFDVVKVDDKLGVRFEMLDSVLFRDLFLNHPENCDEYTTKYAELLKKINTTETTDENIPDSKIKWFRQLKRIEPYIEPKDYQKLYEMIDKIPNRNTFVHGDCHVKNIMIQNNELMLIDMDTLSRGHPIFELGTLIAPYELFEEDCPGNNLDFLKLDADYCTKIYETTMNKYFGKDDKDIKNKIRLIGYVHMMAWTVKYQPDNKKRFEGCKSRMLKLLEQYNDFDLGI